MKEDLLNRMARSPLVFDGAMGTMLYESGVFINSCYDELSLSRGDLIGDIHHRYIQAGVDVIATNSFGANAFKLRPFGLGERVVEINAAAARIAREQAGDQVYVVGSVGPMTSPGQLLPPNRLEEARPAYTEQIRALAEGGVDAILLETFCDIHELQLAAEVARTSDLPVIASFTVDQHGETAAGATAEMVASSLNADDNVDVIGMNCGTGPAGAYDALQEVLHATGKPVLVMPNAGFPREIGGRMLYLTSPEYFTEYAKKFIELGVRGVGGCCGTTPEHIRVAAKAVKSLSGVKQHVEVKSYVEEQAEIEVIPQADKSCFAAKLAAGRPVTSVELLPPRSCDMSKLIAKSRRCALAGVDAINVPDGPRASARISPMVASIAIQRDAGIEAVLHYCCRDRNLIGMQSDLMGSYAAGVPNILIITGDPPKLGEYPDATGVFDVDAIGLTQVASNLNHGRDLGGQQVDPPTGIFIGVGANPVAVDMEREIDRYFRKLDAGAEFAITQPVFDIQALIDFVERVNQYERTIPIVAGVWPLLSFKNAEFMNNEVPGVSVPEETLDRMRRCTSKNEAKETGVKIARETIRGIRDHVQGIQVSAPLGNVDMALAVLAEVL
jgi:homocysteine S-methyltransferase